LSSKFLNALRKFNARHTDWEPYSMVISAEGDDPALTGGQAETSVFRRVGDSIEIYYSLVNVANTATAAAGSGTYIFSIPANLTIDSDVLTIDNGSAGSSIYVVGPAVGTISNVRVRHGNCFVSAGMTSGVKVLLLNDSEAIRVGASSTVNFTMTATMTLSFRAFLPIREFRGGI